MMIKLIIHSYYLLIIIVGGARVSLHADSPNQGMSEDVSMQVRNKINIIDIDINR